MSDEKTLRDMQRLRMTSDEQDDVEHAVGVLMGSASARCRVAARSLMRLLGRHGVPGYASDQDLATAAKVKLLLQSETAAAGETPVRNGAPAGRETVQPTPAAAERKAADLPATWQDECADVEAAFARSGVRPTWPDDEPANIGPMANAMADEIDRLRLTDAEREAIQTAIREGQRGGPLFGHTATLLALLSRLGGDA